MKSNTSYSIKVAALAAVLLAAAGCSDDSVKGVKLNCETGLVVCGNMCCDGTCNDGVCTPSGGGGGEDELCPKGLNECRGACVDYKTAHNNVRRMRVLPGWKSVTAHASIKRSMPRTAVRVGTCAAGMRIVPMAGVSVRTATATATMI